MFNTLRIPNVSGAVGSGVPAGNTHPCTDFHDDVVFRVTGPLCGELIGHREFPTQRPVTRSFDVFFDMRLNKRLSKPS